MGEGIRKYDSNTTRKANKQYHQLEKNMMEKNYFNYIAIVLNNDIYGDGYWCEVKLIPTVNFKLFTKDEGYAFNDKVEELKVIAFRSQNLTLSNNDVVLVVFTDVNSRRALKDLIANKDKTKKFIENDQTKHSIDFGIIINKIL